MMCRPGFEWDETKNRENVRKHGVSFFTAQYAFNDPDRIVTFDRKHSTAEEKRYFCFGRVEDHVITVRFTFRGDAIRIFGAGYWRSGRSLYHEKNKICQSASRNRRSDFDK